MFGKKNKKRKISDLHKGIEKKYEREKLHIKENELKPVTKAGMQIVKSFFWFFFIIIMAAGVFQLVRSKQPRVVENIIRYEIDLVEGDTAKALAKSFVKDYLTYDSQLGNEYATRLRQYIANQVVLRDVTNIVSGSSEVLNVMVWNVTKLDESHSDIVIKADVKIVNKEQTQKGYDDLGQIIETHIEENKSYYVSVPIASKDGKVIINDYPSFVAAPEIADVGLETFSSETRIHGKDKEELKVIMEDFYQVYYSGSLGQVKYFFKDKEKVVSGLEGEFVYTGIQSFEAFEINKNLVKVIVIPEIEQVNTGARFNQRHLFTLEKNKDKWLIQEMKNRGI